MPIAIPSALRRAGTLWRCLTAAALLLGCGGGEPPQAPQVPPPAPPASTVPVPAPGPVLRSITPAAAAVGCPVTLLGEHLQELLSVHFGEVPASALLERSKGACTVRVPAGARSGPVTVRSARGEASVAYTVLGHPGASWLHLSGMHITQAVQRLDGSVPLVAGRDGLLRVFVLASQAGAQQPPVQVTLRDPGGAVLLEQWLPAPAAGVATELREGQLAQSWNLALPGRLIQPGHTLLARLGPGDGHPGSSFPADGVPLTLDVRRVPAIAITLVPVGSAGSLGRVTGANRSLDSWLTSVRQLFPLAEVDLRVGPAFHPSRPISSDLRSCERVLDELNLRRVLEDRATLRYYYGVFSGGQPAPVMGIGYVPPDPGCTQHRCAIGWDGMGNGAASSYHETFAHELGHNLGRNHAPCGGAPAPDPRFPHPGGGIGAYGFDLATGRLIDAGVATDIMGYCSERWVSDYTYQSILEGWSGPARAAEAAPARDCLLVSGRVAADEVELDAAFEILGEPMAPEPGEFTLVCRDGAGQTLAAVPFAPRAIADLPEGFDTRSFLLVLPLNPVLKSRLASLAVCREGRLLAQRGPSVARPAMAAEGATAAAPSREPVALAWAPGVVRLGWDSRIHPRVLIQDAVTGTVLGLGEDGAAELATTARELVLTLSDGVRSMRRRVPVTGADRRGLGKT